ncbi:citrate synthase [Actinoplanes lobatus]|uniref:citrate synthase (unknown stereospecificity) n=1 Tax=Actinoplanes lobatus TaxID=113568 RepID=A0A7W7HHP8_9ACTN|nr:citrate synthase family protein [Actinoplanes lobatus]MBB4750734.1 citrate synthase [Actinoplanes lobatus]GGN68866.1 citrate synthase [Actinoplanes lobatus]GIE42174.1 citrate synthase [Actinoplanes lobatus]
MNAQPLLTTEEVAVLLGVKPTTVYAYVSRGLLTSQRNADGKNSLFAKTDVDAFLASRKRTTTPGIQTGITLIKDGSLYFRGRDATVLARTATYEAVAALLWTGDLQDTPFKAAPELRELAVAVTAPLPETARLTDRLRVTVAAAAAADPLRFDIAPAAVLATGRQLLATMVQALPSRSGVYPVEGASFAKELWHRLTRETPTQPGLRALNAALILLADHDIAASTLAARVAASTRAHPYAVVSAGLAALDGPLHGAASALAYPLLAEAVRGPGPVAALSDLHRSGTPIPGFGHPLYPDGDPRARTLFDLIADGPVRETALEVADTVRARAEQAPNIDLALAAFTLHHGMPADAGEAIFAVARTAGWLAHALEEYGDRPSRFRPTGAYAGLPPL